MNVKREEQRTEKRWKNNERGGTEVESGGKEEEENKANDEK